MSGELASVELDGLLYRVARVPDPWAWPDWAYAGQDGTFGNRYDDPEGSYRVLYASSQRIGAFVETPARFRPDLELLAALDLIDGEEEPPAGVPRTWLATRMIGEATLQGRFADIGNARTLVTLRTALAASAIHFSLDEIDAATIRLKAPRAFTQTLSRFVYEQRDEQGTFAGIRYRSRLGDQFVNWAIFEPPPGGESPGGGDSMSIEPDDADLAGALHLLDLDLV
jgi:hypothetical protein